MTFEIGKWNELGNDSKILIEKENPVAFMVTIEKYSFGSKKYLTEKELYDLICDGIRFRVLKEAEEIKKESGL